MRILLASGKPHLPQAFGGVPSSTHELALALLGRGHDVRVLCGLSPAGLTGFRIRASLKFSKRRFVRDNFLGYPVYRQWDVRANVGAAVAALRPDVAIVQLGELIPIAREFCKHHVPTIIYLHNASVKELHGDPNPRDGIRYVANSAFTAARYMQAFGIDSCIIAPLFSAGRYRVAGRRQNVTFINPIPFKGSVLAFEIARMCPDIPFCFVKTWALDDEQMRNIRREMQTVRNVELRPPTSDMKKIYGRARLVLIPSIIEETWGRVATEAHFSGIPVVASNRGGLPEAVGPGGILLDPEGSPEPWVQAVRRLWTDDVYYNDVRQAALAYAQRPQIDPQRQVDSLLAVIRAARSEMASPCS